MKKFFLPLSVFVILLVFITGCTISKISADSSDIVEEDVAMTPQKDYIIEEKDNISRVSLFNHPQNKADVQINFTRTTNVNVPENIRLKGSSGSVEHTATYIGFKDVEFPFTGTLEYTIKPRLSQNKVVDSKSGTENYNNSSDLRCRLTFTINEPGSWEVKISN